MDRPKLTLVETLRKSIEETPDLAESQTQEEQTENVVDLSIERMRRSDVITSKDVTPQMLFELIASDLEQMKNCVKCYVTLISDDGDSFLVSNYRAGLNRQEEVAFRSLGVQEALDNWRFGAMKDEEAE